MAWHLPPLPPYFHAALRDVTASAPDARIRAAQRLSLAEAEERAEALEGLERLSADVHPGVRAAALAGLGALASPSSLDAVVPRLEDPSPEVCELAVLAIGRIGGPRAPALLAAALRSERPEVRFQAVAAIADVAAGDALSQVLAVIEDPDPLVRSQVAETLGRLATQHSRGHLARLLEDPERAVRREAALSLAHLGDARGESELIAAARERDRVHEVCPALGTIASEAGRTALAELAERLLAPAAQRLWACGGLYLAGDARGTAGLRRALSGFWSGQRNLAAYLVGELKITELASELNQLCTRRRGVDPATLAEALTHLGEAGADVSPGLTALAKRDDDAGETARRWLGPPRADAATE